MIVCHGSIIVMVGGVDKGQNRQTDYWHMIWEIQLMPNTTQFSNGTDQKRYRLAAEEIQARRISGNISTHWTRCRHWITLVYTWWTWKMTSLRWWETSGRHVQSCLGCWGSWGKKGKTRGCQGYFSRRLFQAVLLFGLEKWVMDPHMGRDLGFF